MNPKRTAVLWFAGGLLALAVVLALVAGGVVPVPEDGHVVAVVGLAGAASALLGERRYVQRRNVLR
jgi:membrane associated rhomboid family serine protease